MKLRRSYKTQQWLNTKVMEYRGGDEKGITESLQTKHQKLR